MTEETPGLPPMDVGFLDDVLNYSVDMLSKITMAEFKKHWAGKFFSTDPAVQQQVMVEWETKIAMGRNKPVLIYNDKNEPQWIFPPLLGEMSPRVTATEVSLFSLSMGISAARNRLKTQGEALSDKIFSSQALDTQNREYWQYKLYEIRVECGYPFPGESISDLAQKTPEISTLSQPDDYDF